MGQEKILIADGDKEFCETLETNLTEAGYVTFTSSDGSDAIFKFNSFKPDVVILNNILEKLDGLEVCSQIRQQSLTPIIIASSKMEVFDKVLALELGADDYLVKPVDIGELIARIKAILRRRNNVETTDDSKLITYDKMSLNITNYELILDGKQIAIPARELELFYHLASNPNKVFSRDQLLDDVWGFEYYGDARTVDVHVKKLRDVLKNVSPKWRLKTVWGVGYKFEVDSPF